MKRNSKARFNNIELYRAMDGFYDNPQAEEICRKAGVNTSPTEDTRYYGVFLAGQREKRKIKVDPKRFKKKFGLPKGADEIIAKRKGHYFIPAKNDFFDYNCSIFFEAIAKIKKDWQTEYRPIIDCTMKDILDAEYQFKDMCGFLEPDEAITNSMFLHNQATARVGARRKRLHLSLYAQFFHQMVSSIEAITVSVLTSNGYEGERFDRNVLYTFKGTNQEKIKELKGFAEYGKLYAIWHFIKHNSKSTYDTILTLCPEILVKNHRDEKKLLEYKQGNLAIYHIHFTNELIEKLLDGVTTFFMEYCRVVFGENYDEAQWNYNNYFLYKVNDEIDFVRNPLGLPPWL